MGVPQEQGPRRGPGSAWPTHRVCSVNVHRPKALGISPPPPPKVLFKCPPLQRHMSAQTSSAGTL